MQALDAVAAPLDALRRRLMRWGLAAPGLGWTLRSRDRRLGAHAALGVTAALLLTALFPAFLFVLGPLLLGVAHLLGDLRYLILRRPVPRGVVALALLFSVGLLALRGAEFRGWVRPDASRECWLLELWVGASVVAAGVLARSAGRAALALGVVLTLGALAQRDPSLAQLVFAHAHNLIGVALWLWLFRRQVAPVVPALLLLLAGSILTLSGITWSLAGAVGGLSFGGQELVEVVSWVAPGVPLRWLAGGVLSYIFLQAVHYSVWLSWIPQEDTRGEGTTSFRMSLRSLRAELRGWFWPAMGLVGLMPALGLARGAVMARDTYLALASFHGYLEVTMAAVFFVAPGTRGRRA